MSIPKQVAPVVHVVLRVGTYNDRSLGENVIADHNEISQHQETAFLGKAGKTFSASRRRELEASIGKHGRSFLFVLSKSRDGFHVFRAPLCGVLKSGEVPDLTSVPRYYHDIAAGITTWFEIGTFVEVEQSQLEGLVMLSNGQPLLDTLLNCRTALMLVKKKRG